MFTAILIIAILLVTLTAIGIVSVCLCDGNFFCWWFVAPEVVKACGYALVFLFSLVNDVNS